MLAMLVLSELMTVLAVWILNCCRDMIFSSSVFLVINRYTLTTFLWPILCARSMACMSIIGFQSCSRKKTVSAAVRLSPSPPTLVVSRSTGMVGSL